MTRVVSIGECMLELRRRPDGSASVGWGGDTLNTAVYLARLGVPVAFVTALGRDPDSDEMLAAWREEGVDVSHVLRHPTRGPGLYAIRTDERGERSFSYWRGESAARALFETPGVEAALAFAREADWLYLSGITLSIFDESGRARLVDLARDVRARGGEVAFDPNYRPRGWPSPEAARAAIAAIAAHVSLALPTHSDEDALYGPAGPAEHAARWRRAGVREVVLKRGDEGAVVYAPGFDGVEVPVEGSAVVVDTTGAGDSFNAGYLAARLSGRPPPEAAREANALAGRVIAYPGAIIPRGAEAGGRAGA